ncbi:MAG: Arc family DNA-binding protein [Rubrivivax sp.]|nr:Arc family DNA-binding protein [Rubrivivax sp.]
MGINLSIKDVPSDLAERLRQRAARHHRSLQGELMAIIERAAAEPAQAALATAMPGLRSRTQGWKTVEQLMAERLAAGWRPDPAMAKLPRGVDIVRADRDSR